MTSSPSSPRPLPDVCPNPLLRATIYVGLKVKSRLLIEFRQQLKNPAALQEKRLKLILNQMRGGAMARDLGIASVQKVADLRGSLPVAGYERIAPYIARMEEGDKAAVFHPGVKVLMLAMTSGTTAAAKSIPITSECLAEYRRSWTVWGCALAEAYPYLPFGKMMSLASDWRSRYTQSGIPCGSITGLLARIMRHTLRQNNALPPDIVSIHDVSARYYLSLRLGLAEENLQFITTASPSTLVGLGQDLVKWAPQLIRDLYDGGISYEPAEAVWRAQKKGDWRRGVSVRARGRARFLEAQLQKNGLLTPALAWPHLAVLGVWTAGTLTPYLEKLPTLYGLLPLRDHGLSASEGRITIPLEDEEVQGEKGGVLNVAGAVYEFIPAASYGEKNPSIKLPTELSVGEKYYVVMTTTGGLYRYDMADLVECTGFLEKTPILKFLHKASHIANIVGEKLSAYQAAAALRLWLKVICDLSPSSVGTSLDAWLVEMALAPKGIEKDSAELPHYVLLVEELSFIRTRIHAASLERLDFLLCEQNIEYSAKRRSHRLGIVKLQCVPSGTWKRLRAERMRLGGGTIEQYKHPFLLTDTSVIRSLL